MYFPEIEDVEREDEKRLAHQPIQHQHIFNFYKKMEASFWTDEDIDKDCERDAFDREKASPGENRLFDYVQGFFAVSDFVVGDVISSKLFHRIKNTDLRIIYSFIGMMENIHMITYSKIIDKAIKDKKEKDRVLNMAAKIPSIQKKVDWIKKWVGMNNDIHNLERESILGIYELVERNNRILEAMYPGQDINKYKSLEILEIERKLQEKIPSLDRLLISLALMEGIQFSGSFSVIFWFGSRNLFPGANKANQLIRNDEGMHVETGAIIHRTLIRNKESPEIVHMMTREAVDVEIAFMEDAMPEGLRGMNSKSMAKYIKFSADWVLDMFGYEKLYNIKQNEIFDFMIQQSVSTLISDFFRTEEIAYKLHGENETFTDKKTVFDDDLDEI